MNWSMYKNSSNEQSLLVQEKDIILDKYNLVPTTQHSDNLGPS